MLSRILFALFPFLVISNLQEEAECKVWFCEICSIEKQLSILTKCWKHKLVWVSEIRSIQKQLSILTRECNIIHMLFFRSHVIQNLFIPPDVSFSTSNNSEEVDNNLLQLCINLADSIPQKYIVITLQLYILITYVLYKPNFK